MPLWLDASRKGSAYEIQQDIHAPQDAPALRRFRHRLRGKTEWTAGLPPPHWRY